MAADGLARADDATDRRRADAPPWKPKILHAAPPSAAQTGLAERAGEIQRELQGLLAELLGRAAGGAGDQAGRPSGIHSLRGGHEIDDYVWDACRRATGEVLLAIPGGARPRSALADALPLHQAALRRGLSTRILLQHAVRFDQPTREYVQVATVAGAEFRSLDELCKRFVVIDARTVVMEADDTRTEAVVVTDPIVAQFAAAEFEQNWSRAVRFGRTGPVDAAATVGDGIREAIKRLVAEGLTDSQIGRRVGLKPRAVQNRIRQIKQEMGVESRSELCFLLGRQFDNG